MTTPLPDHARPHTPSRLAMLLLVFVACLSGLGTLTAAHATPSVERSSAHARTAFIDYSYGTTVKPKKVFFYANCGSYVRHLSWSHWGAAKTVGHGQYLDTCAGDCQHARCTPARLVLTRPAYCPSLKVRYYRKALLYRAPAKGQDNPASFSAGSCPKRAPR